MKLRDKVAVVTGSGQGIGRAVALCFAREGASVIIAVRTLSKGEENAELIKKEGGRCKVLTADVSRAEDCKKMMEAAAENFGALDILVNNAGVGAMNSNDNPVELTEEDWNNVLNINLKAAYLAVKYAVPLMRKRGGGAIINISSMDALIGIPGLTAYTASKGGMNSLTKTWCAEYALENIRVNTICPGCIATPMLLNFFKNNPEQDRSALENMHLTRRFGEPEEIAMLAVFLASDEASFVTGVLLVADGGYTAR
jgi:NAD(P)-dependent dehydrogenase (short-subunit alcohol dehydrogenase family)